MVDPSIHSMPIDYEILERIASMASTSPVISGDVEHESPIINWLPFGVHIVCAYNQSDG